MNKSLSLPPFANGAIKSALEEFDQLVEESADLSRGISAADARIEKIHNHTNRVARELHEVQHEVCYSCTLA